MSIKMLATSVAAIVAIGYAGSASAGAFGIEMGTPISKLNIVSHKEGTDYYMITVPTPHSEFESYQVRATPAAGVCRISGLGKDHSGDMTGVAVKSAFDDLHSALSAKYGKNKKFDFLKVGAIWKDLGDFAMALRENERVLDAFWDKDEGSNIPPDITGIELAADATDRSTTYLRLTYQFSNMDKCLAGSKSTDARAL